MLNLINAYKMVEQYTTCRITHIALIAGLTHLIIMIQKDVNALMAFILIKIFLVLVCRLYAKQMRFILMEIVIQFLLILSQIAYKTNILTNKNSNVSVHKDIDLSLGLTGDFVSYYAKKALY